MDKMTTALTIAGFFHDFGKVAERAFAVEPGDKDEVRQQYNYAHAHHTELALLQLFDEGRLSRQIGPEEECSVLNMAARHHKPRNIYEMIVREADWIASGHERTAGDESAADFDTGGRERKSKVPLISILSRIRLSSFKDDEIEDWRYKIGTPESVLNQTGFQNIFPVTPNEYTASMVQEDYRRLWNDFKKAIRPEKNKGLDLFEHFRTVFEITRLYFWSIPATTRKQDMPDVSLFDHSKATAALAACIYEYHKGKSLSEQAVRDRALKKYLLFCGDISGIQKFIYQISSKGAYKLLKGRSFAIQILAEILAHNFVNQCGLLVTNILYASGGKFYLLLPNTDQIRNKLSVISETINEKLFDEFNGDLYVRTAFQELCGDDLTRESGKTLFHIWEELTRKLIYSDRKKYASLASRHYSKLFGIKDFLPATCPVCHRSLESKSNTDNEKCNTCKELETLGQKLGTAQYMAFSTSEKDVANVRPVFGFLGNHVWLLDHEPEIHSPKGLVIYHLNNSDIQTFPLKRNSAKVNGAIFLAGSTHKFDKTFDEIAKMAKGIKRLGILRMDVDNLGKIFGEGLINYKHEKIKHDTRFHSIGRITTLSWQLSLFFSGVVPAMIQLNPEWKDRVTVVYSGGDDLFLLGAWDAVPEVALQIREKFKEFSCHNRSFALSGGMVMTGGRFPIYKSAEMAGDAESRAKKKVTRFKNGVVKKDAFTFLDTPMNWLEFSEVSAQYERLLSIVQEKENRPLLNRLRQIYSACRVCSQAKDRLSWEEIEKKILAERWQWLMVYSLARFGKKRADLQKEIDGLQRFIAGNVAGANRIGIELLGVLGRWCELRLRDN